jgi:hypothetical protein
MPQLYMETSAEPTSAAIGTVHILAGRQRAVIDKGIYGRGTQAGICHLQGTVSDGNRL